MTPLNAEGDYVPDDTHRADAEVASAARTATGTSTPFDTDGASSLEATLTVTAHAGTTPTLDVSLETTIDGGTTWDTVGAFAQIGNANGGDGHVFGPLGDKCRWKWTLAGTTPSYTFKIDGVAARD